jgi:hypothetical protein
METIGKIKSKSRTEITPAQGKADGISADRLGYFDIVKEKVYSLVSGIVCFALQ